MSSSSAAAASRGSAAAAAAPPKASAVPASPPPPSRATAASTAAATKQQKQQPAFVRFVLTAYNVVMFALWAHIFMRTAEFVFHAHVAPHFVGRASAAPALTFSTGLWPRISPIFEFAQTGAFLEVLFAALRWVPSSPGPAFTQCFARCLVVFLTLTNKTPFESRDATVPYSGVAHATIIVLSWSASELCRYSYYAATLLARAPRGLVWLRYSAFIVLYPIGLVNEVAILHRTIPYVAKSGAFSLTVAELAALLGINLPAAVVARAGETTAFSAPRFMQVAVFLFPVGFVPLYRLMLSQRRKQLKQNTD